MPHISSENVATMRKAIRKALPGYVISITKHHHSTVQVRIMSGPVVGVEHVNVYWYKDHFGPHKEDRPDVIALIDIIKAEIFKVETPRELVYDGDYGSVPTFYWDISFGKWDKPYVCTDPDAADRLMIRQELARGRLFDEQERRYAAWKQEREQAA
jgi:hypothetical protein